MTPPFPPPAAPRERPGLTRRRRALCWQGATPGDAYLGVGHAITAFEFGASSNASASIERKFFCNAFFVAAERGGRLQLVAVSRTIPSLHDIEQARRSPATRRFPSVRRTPRFFPARASRATCRPPRATYARAPAAPQTAAGGGSHAAWLQHVAYVSGMDWLADGAPVVGADQAAAAAEPRLLLSYGAGVSDSRVTTLSLQELAALFT